MRRGYFDIHCHILPGVDDGPKTIAETVSLARAFVEDGAAGVIATPHYSLGADIGLFIKHRNAALEETRNALQAEKIKLEIKTGAETMIQLSSEPALAYLALEINAQDLCLGDTNLILIEYPEGPEPTWFEDSLFRLQQIGLQPVLAHTERYSWLRSKKRLADLVERGLYFQINCECLNGFFNPVKRQMKTAAEMRLVHFLASDAHDTRNRRPRLGGIDLVEYFWQMENAKALYKHSESNVFYTS